jgi:hypothetical protein
MSFTIHTLLKIKSHLLSLGYLISSNPLITMLAFPTI